MSLALPPRCLPTLHQPRSEENEGLIQSSCLELLASMVEESDDLSQAQLDAVLGQLVPPRREEAAAAARLAAALLQRTQQTVQPYVQRLLTCLLLGSRTSSELREDYHSLIFQVGAEVRAPACAFQGGAVLRQWVQLRSHVWVVLHPHREVCSHVDWRGWGYVWRKQGGWSTRPWMRSCSPAGGIAHLLAPSTPL